MKGNMGLINIDKILLKFIYDRLKEDYPNSIYTKSMIEEFKNLLNGDISSVLIIPVENTNTLIEKDEVLTIENIKIDIKKRKVTVNDIDANLTAKEFDLLYFLAKNRGEVFTKEQIYKQVWNDNYLLDDSNIMAFIRKIRKKIEPNPDSPRYIITIWGVGYKFNEEL